MWNIAQLFFGLTIIGFGLLINIARQHQGMKTFIEKYILGVGELFDPNAPYAPAVNFAGWKSLIIGLSIAIPLPIWWDTFFLVLAALILVWVILRVRREYVRARDDADREGSAAGA